MSPRSGPADDRNAVAPDLLAPRCGATSRVERARHRTRCAPDALSLRRAAAEHTADRDQLLITALAHRSALAASATSTRNASQRGTCFGTGIVWGAAGSWRIGRCGSLSLTRRSLA